MGKRHGFFFFIYLFRFPSFFAALYSLSRRARARARARNMRNVPRKSLPKSLVAAFHPRIIIIIIIYLQKIWPTGENILKDLYARSSAPHTRRRFLQIYRLVAPERVRDSFELRAHDRPRRPLSFGTAALLSRVFTLSVVCATCSRRWRTDKATRNGVRNDKVQGGGRHLPHQY